MTDQPTAAMSAGRPEGLLDGRYRLERLLGRGGSAEVWRARDEALERPVAVKLVTASGGEDAARVGDEARLLARLSHPGLVPVYDAGTDDSARPYVVMELVEGQTLADRIRRGALPSLEVADIGARLADALAYVHAQGLVHRDVKPANVLLGTDGRVRLTDFGIARLVDAAKVTATGLTVGTASYLSPEQVTGEPVGPPSDVYSLGLVLLECLTGEREYPGTAVEVALARLSRPPRVPASLDSGWPGLLTAMTDRDPAQRPPPSRIAAELHEVAGGGAATTALAAPTVVTPLPADRTQVLDRTRVAAYPAAPRASAPPPPPPVLPVARSRRGAWVAVALVAAIVLLGAAGFLLTQRSSGSTVVPAPAVVNPSLPPKLQNDLQRLQTEVSR